MKLDNKQGDINMESKIFTKELLLAVVIASVVFGMTAVLAYNTAVELHTTGSELIKYFL